MMVHCENAEITKDLTALALANNQTTVRDYFAARPPITEIENVSRVISFAEETGCKLVTEARRRGVDVCCETIGHYLILTDDDVERLGTVAKCSPPIRSQENQTKMWGKLFNGEIAFVSSEHSPCDPQLKNGEFLKVWGDMFMWIGDGVNLGNMTLGASLVVAGVATLNLYQTFAAAIIAIISTVFALNDRLGYRTGIPYVVQLRMSFGLKGSVVSILFLPPMLLPC